MSLPDPDQTPNPINLIPPSLRPLPEDLLRRKFSSPLIDLSRQKFDKRTPLLDLLIYFYHHSLGMGVFKTKSIRPNYGFVDVKIFEEFTKIVLSGPPQSNSIYLHFHLHLHFPALLVLPVSSRCTYFQDSYQIFDFLHIIPPPFLSLSRSRVGIESHRWFGGSTVGVRGVRQTLG